MRSKTMRKVATMLALVMTVTAFAGCGSKEDGDSTTSGTTSGTTTGTTSGTTSGTTDNGTTTEQTKVPGTVTVMTYDRGTIPSEEGDMNNNRWTTWIRENAPVEDVQFTAIPKAEAVNTMNLLLASKEAPDVMANYEATLQFVESESTMVITDEMLDKMPNYKMLLEKYPMMKKTATVNGEMVWLTKFSNISPNHTLVFRQDWLDNLGLSLPKTDEDLYNIIYAFTYNDPDKNGVDDTWGINLTTDAQRILAHMYGFGNPAKYAFDENGNLYYVWDRIESWLTFTKKLVDNKLVNPDFVTMKGDDDQADFLAGKIGVYGSGRFTNANRLNLFRNFKAAFPEGKLSTCALPETQYGRFCAYLNGGASNVGFINSEAKNLEGALAYINWLYDPDTSEYLFYGPDGVYNKINEYGTYAIVDAEKNAIEFDWASDYHIIKNELLDGRDPAISQSANDYYNSYLSSDDPILQEFGVLYYELCQVANEAGVDDPRKWLNDGLPVLPSELALISSTADKEVNNILSAAMADSSKSVADAIKEAKNAWTQAGGEQVDAYYANYYKEMGDAALLASDFTNSKCAPELTPIAQETYNKVKSGN